MTLRALAIRFMLASSVCAMSDVAASSRSDSAEDGVAEARLIQVYRLVGAGKAREALGLAETLVRDFPSFQLAQLVRGDLLAAQVRPIAAFGDIPKALTDASSPVLHELRSEAVLRMAALRHRPPAGAVPVQFLRLSNWNRHAIAVDVSKARLYLFENKDGAARLIADYYISVGKAGVGKAVEGDLRTPLGLYFITSNLDPKSLKNLYGAGALPINYPSAYDLRRGRTGSGIWLHGTPSGQFSRAPRATDGCVAVANPDLLRIIRTVATRSTPVLIAQQLTWAMPPSLAVERDEIVRTIERWQQAKSSGDHSALVANYAADFAADGKSLQAHAAQLRDELTRLRGRGVQLAELSVLGWSDDAQVRVVTFFESVGGVRGRSPIRQYWERRGRIWQIVYETALK